MSGVVFTDLLGRADVGMLQRRCSLGFTKKALFGLGVTGEFRGKEFQGNGALEAGILGLADDTQSAASQRFEDLGVGDGMADHGKPERACMIPTARGTSGTAE